MKFLIADSQIPGSYPDVWGNVFTAARKSWSAAEAGRASGSDPAVRSRVCVVS